MGLKTISSTPIYDGRIFDVRVDRIRDGDKEYDREIVIHKGSAVIVPLFDDGTIALVRQYRHPAGKPLLEIPAGSLDRGEDPRDGAIRELEEEIGVKAGKVEKIAEFWVSPGFLTEKMYLYLATELTESKQNLDDDEDIEIVRMPLQEALRRVYTGEFEDAKTIVGITLAAQHLK